MRLTVVGNPDNRRVGAVPAGRARGAGCPTRRSLPWATCCAPGGAHRRRRAGPDRLARRGRRGRPAAARRADPARHGEWSASPTGTPGCVRRRCGRRGRRRRTLLDRPRRRGGAVRQAASATRVLSAAGVPVPAALPAGRAAIRELRGGDGGGRLAPGVRQAGARVVRVRRDRARGRAAAGCRRVTPVELDRRTALFNSLRVRRYDRRARRRGARRPARPGRAARRAVAAQGRARPTGPSTCGWWWSPAGPPTPWSGPPGAR